MQEFLDFLKSGSGVFFLTHFFREFTKYNIGNGKKRFLSLSRKHLLYIPVGLIVASRDREIIFYNYYITRCAALFDKQTAIYGLISLSKLEN